MTTEVKVFLAGTALALLTAAAVFAIVYPAIHRLLGLSATLRAARSFYGRTFFLAIFLAAWSPILSHGVPVVSPRRRLRRRPHRPLHPPRGRPRPLQQPRCCLRRRRHPNRRRLPPPMRP